MLAGQYPPVAHGTWLAAQAPFPDLRVTWHAGLMDHALGAVRGAFDFVHLSNILDWLTPEQAGATLHLAARALRAGGFVLIRQLNSTLDIPVLGRAFEWDAVGAAALHKADRSFFYRALHLGRRR
jgi:S-adenosylmethionine-diacylglycerol 3-amino-3-carboxypropyl transferase